MENVCRGPLRLGVVLKKSSSCVVVVTVGCVHHRTKTEQRVDGQERSTVQAAILLSFTCAHPRALGYTREGHTTYTSET